MLEAFPERLECSLVDQVQNEVIVTLDTLIHFIPHITKQLYRIYVLIIYYIEL